MQKHLELLPPTDRSRAMGKLRREGFPISPSCSIGTLARSCAKALKTKPPATIDEAAATIRQYLNKPEVDTGYGQVKNWVVYKQPIEMSRALQRAANPYERQPGDGR